MVAAACAGQLCSPCIFFRLSSSGFDPAAAVPADGTGRVLAAGKEKVMALGPDVVSTGGSGMESASSSRTLLNLCSVAFLSASKSSEVAE